MGSPNKNGSFEKSCVGQFSPALVTPTRPLPTAGLSIDWEQSREVGLGHVCHSRSGAVAAQLGMPGNDAPTKGSLEGGLGGSFYGLQASVVSGMDGIVVPQNQCLHLNAWALGM